jgi:hypothetical protein
VRIPEDLFDALVALKVLNRDIDNLYYNTLEVEKYCIKDSSHYIG